MAISMRSLRIATRWEQHHGVAWKYCVLRVTFASWIDCETRHGLRQTSVDCAFVKIDAWLFLVVEMVGVNSPLCCLPIAWSLAFLNSPILLLLQFTILDCLLRSYRAIHSAAWLSSWTIKRPFCLSFWWHSFLAPRLHDRLHAIGNAFHHLSSRRLHLGAISNYLTACPLPFASWSGLLTEIQTDATSTERIHSLRQRLVHAKGLQHSSVKVETSHTA